MEYRPPSPSEVSSALRSPGGDGLERRRYFFYEPGDDERNVEGDRGAPGVAKLAAFFC